MPGGAIRRTHRVVVRPPGGIKRMRVQLMCRLLTSLTYFMHGRDRSLLYPSWA